MTTLCRVSWQRFPTMWDEIKDKRIAKWLNDSRCQSYYAGHGLVCLDEKDERARKIASLVNVLKRDGAFKEIITVYLSDDGIYDVYDGCHRIRAYQYLKKDVQCHTVEGNQYN